MYIMQLIDVRTGREVLLGTGKPLTFFTVWCTGALCEDHTIIAYHRREAHRLAMALKGKSKFKFIKEQLNVTLAINKIGNVNSALATIRGGLTSRL
jgi:hypothetical protein